MKRTMIGLALAAMTMPVAAWGLDPRETTLAEWKAMASMDQIRESHAILSRYLKRAPEGIEISQFRDCLDDYIAGEPKAPGQKKASPPRPGAQLMGGVWVCTEKKDQKAKQ